MNNKQFKKNLKKFNMEEEFSNWLHDIKSVPTEFKVGERVMYIDPYPGTKKGSRGTILKIYGDPLGHDPTARILFDDGETKTYYFWRLKLIA